MSRCPSLFDEHRLVGVEIELTLESYLALLQGVGAILLRRMAGPCSRLIPGREDREFLRLSISDPRTLTLHLIYLS